MSYAHGSWREVVEGCEDGLSAGFPGGLSAALYSPERRRGRIRRCSLFLYSTSPAAWWKDGLEGLEPLGVCWTEGRANCKGLRLHMQPSVCFRPAEQQGLPAQAQALVVNVPYIARRGTGRMPASPLTLSLSHSLSLSCRSLAHSLAPPPFHIDSEDPFPLAGSYRIFIYSPLSPTTLRLGIPVYLFGITPALLSY